MADILSELEGILDPATMASLRSNPEAVNRFARRDEVYNYYTGESDSVPPSPPAAVTPPVQNAPPARHVAPAPADGDSFAAIMARLDSIGNVDEKVESAVKRVVEARGGELSSSAVATSINITRELTRLDNRHRTEFGEDLDDVKLNEHITKAKEEGRPFRTVTDAYEDLTRDVRDKKRIEEGVRAGLQERASGQVPGVTPAGSTPMLRILKSAGRSTTAGDSGNHVDRAAAALTARLAERGESVA